jgi:ribosomal protein S13
MTMDLTKLKANSADIKGWTEALQRVADWDSSAAEAIRRHIDVLMDRQARILRLSEDEIAKINEEAEAATEAEIHAEMQAFWRALEGAPSDVIAEIKRLVERLILAKRLR